MLLELELELECRKKSYTDAYTHNIRFQVCTRTNTYTRVQQTRTPPHRNDVAVPQVDKHVANDRKPLVVQVLRDLQGICGVKLHDDLLC